MRELFSDEKILFNVLLINIFLLIVKEKIRHPHIHKRAVLNLFSFIQRIKKTLRMVIQFFK